MPTIFHDLWDALAHRLGVGSPSAKPAFVVLPDGSGTATLVRDGYEVKTFKAGARPAVAHRFTDLKGFALYLGRRADAAHCDVLLDVDEFTATNQPGTHDAWSVTCAMQKHPRWSRWEDALDVDLDQAAIYRLFVAARDDFEAMELPDGTPAGSYGRELAGQLRSLRVSRDASVEVDLDENGNYRAAAASDKHVVSAKLPSEFNIVVPVFDGVWEEPGGLAVYAVHLHLDVKVQDKGPPIFRLRCPDLDLVMREASRDAGAYLQRELDRQDDDFLVCMGTSRFTDRHVRLGWGLDGEPRPLDHSAFGRTHGDQPSQGNITVATERIEPANLSETDAA